MGLPPMIETLPQALGAWRCRLFGWQ